MRILHVFRTPVGGLFRHVRDLVRGQSAHGHQVGIICDSTTGGLEAQAHLDGLKAHCALRITRIPISRLPGLGDVLAVGKVAGAAAGLRPDIIHGHGAKGGLSGRLAARRLGLPSVYTPHGGSLHYSWAKPAGALYLSAETILRRIGSGLLFVCAYERQQFDHRIGLGGKPCRVVHNGLWPEEFEPVRPQPDATDILYLGELRTLKGADLLLRALALLNEAQPVTATIVGEGEDRARFLELAADLKLDRRVRFAGAMPARQAFGLGRLFVMPSRAESFPYVVLEAAAAGLPIIATKVGGIPEILAPEWLVSPDNADELAAGIRAHLAAPRQSQACTLLAERFSAERMCAEVTEFYRDLVSGRANSLTIP